MKKAGRAFSALAVALLGSGLIAGCSSNPELPVEVAPGQTNAVEQPIPEAPAVPSPEPIPTAEAPELASGFDDEFECVAPTPAVENFQRKMTISSAANWTPPETVMVEVGPGNNPAEIWWIVAWQDEPLGRWNRSDRVFLTNAPSEDQTSAERWISVSHHVNLLEADGWGQVQWPEAQKARGQRAERFALVDCLGIVPTQVDVRQWPWLGQ